MLRACLQSRYDRSLMIAVNSEPVYQVDLLADRMLGVEACFELQDGRNTIAFLSIEPTLASDGGTRQLDLSLVEYNLTLE